MRTLSADALTALFAQETDKVLLARIEISHASILGGPLRFVNNMSDVVAGANTYTAFPFQITLPDEDDQGGVPKIKLLIDNVDRQIVQTIRSLPPSPAPTVKVELFLAHQPTTVEVSYADLILRQVPYNVFTVEGDLLLDDDDLEPYPQYSFSPANFPGLFALMVMLCL